MGDVPPQAQHDADVAAADAQQCLDVARRAAPAPPRWRCCCSRRISSRSAAGNCSAGRGSWISLRASSSACTRRRCRRRARRMADDQRGQRRIPARARHRRASCTTAKRWCRPSTALGGGFWVMTPLRTADGTIGADQPRLRCRPSGATAPHAARASRRAKPRSPACCASANPAAACLRRNDPAADRWYSRDVAGHRRGARSRRSSRPTSSMPKLLPRCRRSSRSAG